MCTLDNFAPGCFLEELPLGYYSLCAGPLPNCDLDHRRSRGATRVRQIPDTTHQC